MANASQCASFVLDRRGKIVHWNTAAETIVRNNDVLTLTNGRLTACNRQSDIVLSRLISEVASPLFSLSGATSNRFVALQSNSNKRPFHAMATPLPETLRRSGGDLMLLVSDPEKTFSFPDDALHTLYRFTPAETEVANGMLMGYSAEEIACLRCVTAATVRQQIKSMLAKTGTSRQTEMIRLFLTLPRPFVITP